MAGKFRFEPCPSCCECDACDGPLPSAWEVTISGVLQDPVNPCANCSDLNGTYLIDERTAGSCTWSLAFPSSVCGFDHLYLSIYESVSGWVITVEVRGSGVYFNWSKNYGVGTKPSCSTLTDEALPDTGRNISARCYGGTCTITAA